MNNQTNIVKKLKDLQRKLETTYFSRTKSDHQLKSSVLRGNTARSYQFNENFKPSSMVKNWLHTSLLEEGSKTLHMVLEENDFKVLHAETLKDLKKFWKRLEPNAIENGMQFYHFAKIVDLLFKSMPVWERLSRSRQTWFYQNANVPIDKYSLQALQDFLPQYGHLPDSMRAIGNDKKLYHSIQEDIRGLVKPLPPLLFDLYAWDYLRVKKIEKPSDYNLVSIK